MLYRPAGGYILKKIRSGYDARCIRVFNRHPVSDLCAKPEEDGIVVPAKIPDPDIPADADGTVQFNIAGIQDGPDILIQTFLWQTVFGNSVPEHAARLFMLVKYHSLMAHQS